MIRRLLLPVLPGLCCIALLGGAVCAPGPAAAQVAQTGTLAGTVVDAGDTPLIGVPVTLTGPQGGRTVVTDEGGRFRFPALPVGTYRVSAALLELSAPARAVTVYLGRTSDLRLELRRPEDAEAAPAEEPPVLRRGESIEVLAEAPIVDRFETRVGANVSFELLDELPVPRFYQSVALLLPGVAGGEDGNPNVSGALRSANLFLIDGVDTTDPTTGLFGLNLPYEAVREVKVTTAAPPVSYGRASGAIIDVVTRSGGNRFQGLARWIATDPSWGEEWGYESSEFDAVRREIEAANAGSDERQDGLSALLSGPLWRDRAWFLVAYEEEESRFARPTRTGRLWDEAVAIDQAAVKLTLQPSGRDSAVLQYTADSAEFDRFSPFDRGPGENRASPAPTPLGESFVGRLPGDVFAVERRSQDGEFLKLEWNRVLSQNLSLSGGAAVQDRELTRSPSASRGLTADAPHVVVTEFTGADAEALEIREVALFNGITDEGFEDRPRQQAGVELDWFRQWGRTDHEVRLGVDTQHTESERKFNVPGRPGTDRATGRAVEGQLFLDLDLSRACIERGVCAPFDPATGEFAPLLLLNFWERPARSTEQDAWAVYLSDAITLGRWLVDLGVRVDRVEGTGPEGRPLVDDSGVAPRVGIKGDLFGDGRLLLSASWTRLLEPFLHQYLDSFARLEDFAGHTEYVWAGAAGFDCSGFDPTDVDSPCWIPSQAQGFSGVRAAPPEPDLERARVEEWVVGAETQVSPLVGLSLHWIRRDWDELWDEEIVRVPGPGGEPRFEARIANLEEARRRYEAVQLLVQKRFARRWQMLGSYTWSQAEGNHFSADGFSPVGDLTAIRGANRFGLAPYQRKHQLETFGSYRLPLGPVDLSLGGALLYQTGAVFQQEATDRLGTLFLTPRGSDRLEDVFRLDLALGIDLELPRGWLVELKGEVFNLTGEEEQLGAEANVGRGFGLPRSITDLQAPRSVRLTMGLRF